MIGARRIGSCDAQQRHSARAGRRAGRFDATWQAAAGDGWNIHAVTPRHDSRQVLRLERGALKSRSVAVRVVVVQRRPLIAGALHRCMRRNWRMVECLWAGQLPRATEVCVGRCRPGDHIITRHTQKLDHRGHQLKMIITCKQPVQRVSRPCHHALIVW